MVEPHMRFSSSWFYGIYGNLNFSSKAVVEYLSGDFVWDW